MKTTIFKSILALFLLTSCLISCNSDEEVASPPPPPGLTEFLYREGGAPSLSSVTDPIANASSKEIFGRNGTAVVVKIRLTS